MCETSGGLRFDGGQHPLMKQFLMFLKMRAESRKKQDCARHNIDEKLFEAFLLYARCMRQEGRILVSLWDDLEAR